MANIKFSQFSTTTPIDSVNLVGYWNTSNIQFTIADLKNQFNNSYVTLNTTQSITATKQFTTFPILGDQAYTASYGSDVKLYSSHNADSSWIFNSVGVHDKIFSFRVNDLQRWAFRVNQDAETGSNAGTNFEIRRYNDAGTFIDSPISITRSNGTVAFGGNIELAASMNLGDGVTLSNGELQTLDGIITGVTIQNQLDSKEPTIANGTSSQFWKGNKTWATIAASDVPSLDASKITTGTLGNQRMAKAIRPVIMLTTAATSGNSTSEINIASITIPANSLSVGDVIRIGGFYSFASNTGTKSPKVRIGLNSTSGNQVYAPSALAASLNSNQFEVLAIVTSSTNLRTAASSTVSGFGTGTGALTNTTIDITQSLSFSFNIQKTTGADTAILEFAWAEILTS